MIRCEPAKGDHHVKVTFAIPARGTDERVSVVGDFNHWDPVATPLAPASNVAPMKGRGRSLTLKTGHLQASAAAAKEAKCPLHGQSLKG